MGLICIIFGHKYRAVSVKESVVKKGEFAKHEYEEIRVYQCKRCGNKIEQEEHFQ